MDNIPNGTTVIVPLLGEGQCSPNQLPNALTKRVGQLVQYGLLTTFFANRSMALG